MNSLNSTPKTISSLEIAQMLQMEHWKLLRKLEGTKEHKGYVQILGDNNFVVSDYFIKETYTTSQGKTMPCYQFTKLGCDFIANKFSGEKGVVFTAAYVKRFYEMEKVVLKSTPESFKYLNGFANFLNSIRRVMKDEGCTPEAIAAQVKLLCDAYGVPLIEGFVKPNYEQLTMRIQSNDTLSFLN